MYIARVYIQATLVCAVVAYLHCPNCCTFATRHKNDTETVKLSNKTENVEIWYKSNDSETTAHATLISQKCFWHDLRKCHGNQPHWKVNETDIWKKQSLTITEGLIKYVKIWSDGLIEWSTCNPTISPSHPNIPHEHSEQPAKDAQLHPTLSLVTAVVLRVICLLLIIVNIALISYIIKARKHMRRVEAKLKAALDRPEVPLQVIDEKDNPTELLYAEWDESYMRKYLNHPTAPPPSSYPVDSPRPQSSHESVNSLYDVITPQ